VNDAVAQWLRTEEDLTLLMAHDLRNPLAAIVANLSFLEMVTAPDDEDAQGALRDLRHSSDLLLRLIDNTAAVARMESPRAATLPRSAVALAPVFATVAERHRDEGRATPRLRVLAPPSDLAVLGDPGLVEGIVDNLAVAALRHARRGFDARIEARAGSGVAEISLEDEGTRYSDDGAEFARSAQPRLQQGGQGRYAPGAGLYVIGLVARAFGGDVSVRRLGERDRLVVTLPLAR